jgi:hypothetical protein
MSRFVRLVLWSWLTVLSTGVTPALAGTITTVPAVDFGDVFVAGSAAQFDITLTNSGSTTTLSGSTLTGANTADFSVFIVAGVPLVLGNGDTAIVSLLFAPSAVGTRTATVTFLTDSPSGASVSLTGVGVPEPGMLSLLALGLGAVALRRSRRAA